MVKTNKILLLFMVVLFVSYVCIHPTKKIIDNAVHTINVSDTPGPFTLSSDAEDPEIDGKFNLTWTDSDGADTYSIYSYNKTIIDLNSSLTLIYQNATSPFEVIAEPLIGRYYIVVAYNESGYTFSNCIYVFVDQPEESLPTLDPWIIVGFLGGLVGVAIIYGIIKRIKS